MEQMPLPYPNEALGQLTSVGWEIVISGRNFDPTEFIRTSSLRPTAVWEREAEERGLRYKLRGIEFSDWQPNPYPLDMVTEALDYLEANRDEFDKLCRMSGIEERCLNFVDCCRSRDDVAVFDFSVFQLASLAAFGISVSICMVKCDAANSSS